MARYKNDFLFDKDFDTRYFNSPCVGICDYNDEDYCTGCKRHMNEIYDWYDYTDEMRAAINKDLKTRRINV